jgi:hypothetical protein
MRTWKLTHCGARPGLARLLKPFGIAPEGMRICDETPKGYQLGRFTDAFARYLPPQGAA